MEKNIGKLETERRITRIEMKWKIKKPKVAIPL